MKPVIARSGATKQSLQKENLNSVCIISQEFDVDKINKLTSIKITNFPQPQFYF